MYWTELTKGRQHIRSKRFAFHITSDEHWVENAFRNWYLFSVQPEQAAPHLQTWTYYSRERGKKPAATRTSISWARVRLRRNESHRRTRSGTNVRNWYEWNERREDEIHIKTNRRPFGVCHTRIRVWSICNPSETLLLCRNNNVNHIARCGCVRNWDRVPLLTHTPGGQQTKHSKNHWNYVSEIKISTN